LTSPITLSIPCGHSVRPGSVPCGLSAPDGVPRHSGSRLPRLRRPRLTLHRSAAPEHCPAQVHTHIGFRPPPRRLIPPGTPGAERRTHTPRRIFGLSPPRRRAYLLRLGNEPPPRSLANSSSASDDPSAAWRRMQAIRVVGRCASAVCPSPVAVVCAEHRYVAVVGHDWPRGSDRPWTYTSGQATASNWRRSLPASPPHPCVSRTGTPPELESPSTGVSRRLDGHEGGVAGAELVFDAQADDLAASRSGCSRRCRERDACLPRSPGPPARGSGSALPRWPEGGRASPWMASRFNGKATGPRAERGGA